MLGVCALQLVWTKKIISTWIIGTCTGGKVCIALLQPNLHDSKISRGHGQELNRSREQTLGLNHGPLDAKIGLKSHDRQTCLRSLSLVSLCNCFIVFHFKLAVLQPNASGIHMQVNKVSTMTFKMLFKKDSAILQSSYSC